MNQVVTRFHFEHSGITVKKSRFYPDFSDRACRATAEDPSGEESSKGPLKTDNQRKDMFVANNDSPKQPNDINPLTRQGSLDSAGL